MTTLGEIVARRREELGWELARLARDANVNERTLYNFEKGKTATMRSDALDRVAEKLGVTVDEMREEASRGWPAALVLGYEDEPELLDALHRISESRKLPVADLAVEMLWDRVKFWTAKEHDSKLKIHKPNETIAPPKGKQARSADQQA